MGTDRDGEKGTKQMRHIGVRRTLERFKSFVASQNVSVNLKLRPNNKLGNRVLLKHWARPHLSLERPPAASPSPLFPEFSSLGAGAGHGLRMPLASWATGGDISAAPWSHVSSSVPSTPPGAIRAPLRSWSVCACQRTRGPLCSVSVAGSSTRRDRAKVGDHRLFLERAGGQAFWVWQGTGSLLLSSQQLQGRCNQVGVAVCQ